MPNADKLVVTGLIAFFLGVSYVAMVYALASEYVLPATVGYVAVAIVLLLRILPEKENE